MFCGRLCLSSFLQPASYIVDSLQRMQRNKRMKKKTLTQTKNSASGVLKHCLSIYLYFGNNVFLLFIFLHS